MPELTPQEVIIRHVKGASIRLKRSFWRHCLLRTCFIWTADGTLKGQTKTKTKQNKKQNKTRSTGYVFRCKHSERRKAKEKEVTFSRKLRLIMTCHHDMSVPLRHLLCALCSAGKACYIYDWLKLYENLGWAVEHGCQWRHFATNLHRSQALALYLQLCSNVLFID